MRTLLLIFLLPALVMADTTDQIVDYDTYLSAATIGVRSNCYWTCTTMTLDDPALGGDKISIIALDSVQRGAVGTDDIEIDSFRIRFTVMEVSGGGGTVKFFRIRAGRQVVNPVGDNCQDSSDQHFAATWDSYKEPDSSWGTDGCNSALTDFYNASGLTSLSVTSTGTHYTDWITDQSEWADSLYNEDIGQMAFKITGPSGKTIHIYTIDSGGSDNHPRIIWAYTVQATAEERGTLRLGVKGKGPAIMGNTRP